MTAISRSQSKGAVDMGCHSLPRSNMAGPTLSHQRLHKACEFVFAADQKVCFLDGVMERSCAATTVKRHTAVMRSYRILSASYRPQYSRQDRHGFLSTMSRATTCSE